MKRGRLRRESFQITLSRSHQWCCQRYFHMIVTWARNKSLILPKGKWRNCLLIRLRSGSSRRQVFRLWINKNFIGISRELYQSWLLKYNIREEGDGSGICFRFLFISMGWGSSTSCCSGWRSSEELFSSNSSAEEGDGSGRERLEVVVFSKNNKFDHFHTLILSTFCDVSLLKSRKNHSPYSFDFIQKQLFPMRRNSFFKFSNNSIREPMGSRSFHIFFSL